MFQSETLVQIKVWCEFDVVYYVSGRDFPEMNGYI